MVTNYYSFPAFADLESQDWHLAMAMQFQEGNECQVSDPFLSLTLDDLTQLFQGVDWAPQGEEAIWWSY